ncbi:periphilin-1 isoform X5 [Oenanthe melanoleuca]|uniref:periphilin-1 isoform X5 n=1 Tax=Oenanthe melanoleuca TaxID=2939378 RepID=UPI0024C198FE|nr:periphilin-1 isoform X5 [Oenanthe melanoleuca]
MCGGPAAEGGSFRRRLGRAGSGGVRGGRGAAVPRERVSEWIIRSRFTETDRKWRIEEMRCGLKGGMTMEEFHENASLQGFMVMDVRDGYRRKNFYSSHYVRDRSPHKRDSPFFRESPGSRRDSPHSRSGSSVSSRSYSPERSKAYPFHQHSRSKERAVQSLKTSRDASPSGSTAVPSSKASEKSNRLSEKELAEAASKWAAEKSEKAEENNLPEITEYDAGSSAPLYIEQTEETEANLTDSAELYEDSHLLSRAKAIAAKTKEIEQVYRQDCETFGMVVKMLIDKDPSLEKSIQFALRQNLHEIGERCIEELKHFIAQYDAANQDVSEPFKEGSY